MKRIPFQWKYPVGMMDMLELILSLKQERVFEIQRLVYTTTTTTTKKMTLSPTSPSETRSPAHPPRSSEIPQAQDLTARPGTSPRSPGPASKGGRSSGRRITRESVMPRNFMCTIMAHPRGCERASGIYIRWEHGGRT